jgi:hypothetical protein
MSWKCELRWWVITLAIGLCLTVYIEVVGEDETSLTGFLSTWVAVTAIIFFVFYCTLMERKRSMSVVCSPLFVVKSKAPPSGTIFPHRVRYKIVLTYPSADC